jgi:chromate transporter
MDMKRGEPPSDQERLQGSPAAQAGVLDLFTAFMGVGLSGFGGVLPFARRMLVDRRRWLSPAEFTEVLGLSQLLPGPNIVNVTIYVGARFAGIPGAVAAFLGLMTAMAAKIAWPVLRSAPAIVVALLVFVAIAVLKVPLIWAIAVLAPVSVIWTWWRTP